MASKTSKSKKSRSSSTSTTTKTVSKNGKKTALGMKSGGKTNVSKQSVAVGGQREKRARPALKQKRKVKKKEKFDPQMPKKPATAFFYFLEDFRKDFQEQNPDVKSMRDIGKACGEKWKTMTYEEKIKYYDIATEKRAEFDNAMAEYIKRKESGDEDTEDDSEFDEYE